MDDDRRNWVMNKKAWIRVTKDVFFPWFERKNFHFGKFSQLLFFHPAWFVIFFFIYSSRFDECTWTRWISVRFNLILSSFPISLEFIIGLVMDSREVIDDQDIQRWTELVKETLGPLDVDIDQWFCYLCNNLPFSCASDLRRHVISEHNQLHSDFIRHKHRLPKGSPAFRCPICG